MLSIDLQGLLFFASNVPNVSLLRKVIAIHLQSSPLNFEIVSSFTEHFKCFDVYLWKIETFYNEISILWTLSRTGINISWLNSICLCYTMLYIHREKSNIEFNKNSYNKIFISLSQCTFKILKQPKNPCCLLL